MFLCGWRGDLVNVADDGATESDELFVRQRALRPVDVLAENLSILDRVRPATGDGENVIHRCVGWTELFTRQGTAEVLANQQVMNFLNGHVNCDCDCDGIAIYLRPAALPERLGDVR